MQETAPLNSAMNSRTRRYWQQLSNMTWDELRTRGRQELTKRWDLIFYAPGKDFAHQSPDLQQTPRPGRFFSLSQELPLILHELRERFPGDVNEILDSAERICTHHFSLLGYESLDYGPEVDWHFDAVHGKRAQRKPWFKIRYLDFEEVGDSKVIWELNRHQFLITLAKAYCLTNKKHFAEELFRLWYHWQKENPYPIGINWASSLEVALRSISWLWVWHLLKNCSRMPSSFPDDLRRALALHGRHIEQYLSTYFSPNTHLIGEGVALFFLGTLCPEIRNAGRWKAKGWQIIQREAERQVQPDGMYFEQSLHYHVYAIDFFLQARILAAANGTPVPSVLDRTLIKMMEALCSLSQAGTLPHLGDDDGGRVFNPIRNRVEHLFDPLSTGAVVYGRGDFKAAGKLCEETLWLLGKEGVTRFDALEAKDVTANSVCLPSSGMYVMADSQAFRQQLVIDAGPQGTGQAGHGHADALSIHLSVEGHECLSDPGTYTYVSHGVDRDLFRGTGAHNTLQVDGLDQAEPSGPFAWRFLPKACVETWQNGETFDLFVASHTGYLRLPKPVLHRRMVFYLKSKFWLVRDVATGEGEHQLDLFWHFAPGLEIGEETPATSFAIQKSGEKEPVLALLASEGHDFRARVEQVPWSPCYGRLMLAPALCFSRKTSLPSEIATLLVPRPGPLAEWGQLTRLKSEQKDSPACGYQYSTAMGSHYIFFAESGQQWKIERWASNARFLYCATSPGGQLLQYIFYEGSYLALDEQPLFEKKQRASCVEWRNGSEVPDDATREKCTPLSVQGSSNRTDENSSRAILERSSKPYGDR